MQFVAILGSLAVSGSLISAGLYLRHGARKRSVRPAVAGGRRRDYFGDAHAHLKAVPRVAADETPARRAA